MKILMVNNRLKVYGGEGTYMTSVGDQLKKNGHDVQYFGLRDENGLYINKFEIYAKKSKNPFSIFRSKTNQRRFAKLLDLYNPDVIHLNLVYFTLTPSILIEAKKRNIPIVQTIHDGKIICPSYQLFDLNNSVACSKCIDHNFKRCFYDKCVKGSRILSYLAFKEATFNQKKHFYNFVDKFIFPSQFMMNLHVKFGIDLRKCVYLQNFSRIQKNDIFECDKEDYVLFFGRIEKIKGVDALKNTILNCPDIKFKVAGNGSMISIFKNISNCEILGFLTGESLNDAIRKAKVCVFPSIWNENCPMGVAESIALGTPVICSNIGGMPEMVEHGVTGYLVRPNDSNALEAKIRNALLNYCEMSKKCFSQTRILNISDYCEKLMDVYASLTRTAQ